MFGQGMGPLERSDGLVQGESMSFRESALITLRGSRGGLPLLESIGVTPARVLTTGDEAIELAYAARAKEPGNAVGINLRVASYADVKTDTIGKGRIGLAGIRPAAQSTSSPDSHRIS